MKLFFWVCFSENGRVCEIGRDIFRYGAALHSRTETWLGNRGEEGYKRGL